MSGTSLNHYQITSPIGAGGMGDGFRARDSRLHRDLVVKVLPGRKRTCIIPSSGCHERP